MKVVVGVVMMCGSICCMRTFGMLLFGLIVFVMSCGDVLLLVFTDVGFGDVVDMFFFLTLGLWVHVIIDVV